jgi:hypothetical protein
MREIHLDPKVVSSGKVAEWLKATDCKVRPEMTYKRGKIKWCLLSIKYVA